MQILSINNYQPNHKLQTFKAGPVQTAGTLKYSTSRNVEAIMSAYREIMSRLACKTDEGLKKIQENFKNVTIGEGITFHNCGERGTSILIRSAESKKYHNLTRIIERKGRSINYGTKIVINSFILDGNNRLLENKDENVQKSYPSERVYLTSEEIEKGDYNNRLERVLNDLDAAMLPFRKYLLINRNEDLKLPDGKIPFGLVDDMKKIEDLHKDIDLKLGLLPAKAALEARKSYPSCRFQTGLKTHSFTYPDGSYIVYTPSEGEYDLKRFVKYDKDGKVLKLFMAVDGSKLVSNLNKDYPAYIPDNFKYADEAQIQQEEFLPDFQELLSTYKLKLMGLSKAIETYLDESKLVETKIPLPEAVSSAFESASETYDKVNEIFKKIPVSEGIAIRKAFPEFALGIKGLTFNNYEDDTSVQLLPVNSNKHTGLSRFTVKKSGKPEQIYLLKDNKYIVSNYNPRYPLVIPNILKFADDSEIKEVLQDAMPYISYMKKKADEYKSHVESCAEEFRNSKIEKEEAKEKAKEKVKEKIDYSEFGEAKSKQKIRAMEKRNLIKECQKLISDAINSENIENLYANVREIKNKMDEFLTHNAEHQ